MSRRREKTVLKNGGIAACLLILLVGAIVSGVWRPGAVWGLVGTRALNTVPGIPKDGVVKDDDDLIVITGGTRKANVLFLLDVGSSMTFSPTGKLPDYPTLLAAARAAHPNSTDVELKTVTQPIAAEALADCTYGAGVLPLLGGDTTSNGARSRYGRDLDPTNNASWADVVKAKADADAEAARDGVPLLPDAWVKFFINKHIDNYYFPFNQTGSELSLLHEALSADRQPLALVLKQTTQTSGYSNWRSPTAPHFNPTNLVPNDSRLYKLKLVMWRLLDHKSLFENVRFGMATTFQEMCTPMLGDFYKRGGFGAFVLSTDVGAVSSPDRVAPQATIDRGDQSFKYGSGPGWATGLNDSNYGMGGAYNESETTRIGVMRDYYDAPTTSYQWKHLNRAVLRVPIGEYSEDHLRKFRLWIDGLEDVSDDMPGSDYYYRNPELTADGKTYLSTALFPGHPNLDRQGLISTNYAGDAAFPGVVFSRKDARVEASRMYGAAGDTSRAFNTFNAGSGEALGTALDFFSPPVSSVTPGLSVPDQANVAFAPEVSFPLTQACDTNWVVIFSAGDDSQSSTYSTAAAAAALYNYTRDHNLTQLDTSVTSADGPNAFQSIRLEDGIRTLVVGFVDENDMSPEAVDLRQRLNAAAVAGDPGNPSARAYFANDVPGLINALSEVMLRINGTIRPAKVPLTAADSLETEAVDGTFDLYGTSYAVDNKDQWEGQLTRYSVAKDPLTGKQVRTFEWELGAKLLEGRRSLSGPTTGLERARNLRFWDGDSYEPLPYSTGIDALPTASVPLGLGPNDMDTTFRADFLDKIHPSRALINWHHGYNYSYKTPAGTPADVFERRFILSDFGRSGVVAVGPPSKTATSQPGYAAWADSTAVKNRALRLFAQSNAGILHVLNPRKTDATIEEMALIPPPVMQPFRLASTKFDVITATTGTGTPEKTVQWVDDTPEYHSRPSYLLDGPLVMKNFDLGGATGWRTYLFGMLGRGGNGLYAMDVTDPSNPVFKWYLETTYRPVASTARPYIVRQGPSQFPPIYSPENITLAEGDLYIDANSHPFAQMGYNMPKPGVGVARLPGGQIRNMLVLSGGMQETLDLNHNGVVGAALYIMDPEHGYKRLAEQSLAQQTRVFNGHGGPTSFLNNLRAGSGTSGVNPNMGMLVSEPTLVRSGTAAWATGKILTADNRGNIFMVRLESGEDAEARPLDVYQWTMQTVGTLRARGEVAANDNHSIPHGLLLARVNNSSALWVSGGTANVGTRNNDANDSALIRNKGQHLFAFAISEDRVRYRDDLVALTADSSSLAPNSSVGWYVTLQAATPMYEEEYVTTRPVLMGGKIYCATFVPKIDRLNCTGTVDGITRIYAIDVLTGESRWERDGRDKKYVEYAGVKAASITMMPAGNLHVEFAETNAAAAAQSATANVLNGVDNVAGGIDIWPDSSVATPLGVLGSYLNYWRETQ